MSEEWRVSIEVGGNDVLLLPGETTLGRSDVCDVVLADSSVSRRHAVIRVDGRQVFLRDLGSSNGTYVGGEEIAGEVQLADGDRVEIGDRLVVPRIRSLLAGLEGDADAFGGPELAVGSATTSLQRASLDLAMKAQEESERERTDDVVAAEDEGAFHRRPTEVRPLPEMPPVGEAPEPPGAQAMQVPSAQVPGESSPASTIQVSAADLRSELSPASTLQVSAADLREEVASAAAEEASPTATVRMTPEEVAAAGAEIESPAATMQVSAEAIRETLGEAVPEPAPDATPASAAETVPEAIPEPTTETLPSAEAPSSPEGPARSWLASIASRVRGWFSSSDPQS